MMKRKTLFVKIFESISQMIDSVIFQAQCKQRLEDFVRKRKMGFKEYIWYMLANVKRSLASGLHSFLSRMHSGVEYCTKQAFSQGRLRINPEAFRLLLNVVRDQFYENADCRLWHGYRVSAIDGSKCNLPLSKELVEKYGIQKGTGGQVQALISCLYDVLNMMILDADMFPHNANERDLASRHISRLKAINQQVKDLLLFDRGYPSAKLLQELQAKGLFYVMRCSSSFCKMINLSGDDNITEHKFSKLSEPMKIRIIRVCLDDKTTEILATNIFDSDISAEDFKKLYHLRWEIETTYGTMKHKLMLEDFSGKTDIAVQQDFLAMTVIVNLLGVIQYDNRDEIEALQAEKPEVMYKYKQNLNYTIGLYRDNLIELVVCKSHAKRLLLYYKLRKAMQKNLVPVRPGRSSPRVAKHPGARFAANLRLP